LSVRSFPRTTVRTGRLMLRPFEPDDATDVHAVWNEEVYLRFAPVGFALAGADRERAIEWCTSGVEERRRAGDGVTFAVVPRDADRLVGLVSLSNADWAALVTEIHYWTAPWGRGRGYATDATRAIARWALTEQGLARVSLEVVIDNVASVRVAEAAGFKLEGVLRDAAMTNAGRGDVAVYSLIARDLG
jgi:ribosomal-protein-alanine N-acetyltransferase